MSQQAAHLIAGRIRPCCVGLVGQRRARGQQPERPLGCGQGYRGSGCHFAFRLVAVLASRIEVDADAGSARQPIAGPAAKDGPGAQRRAEPADERGDVLLGGGRWPTVP
jgi:hypothetical protein